MALARARHNKFIFTSHKFRYLHIMLHNACIVFFLDRASATTRYAARCAITAPLAPKLGGRVPISTRCGSYDSPGL
jgi:hypothetical protein